MPSDSSIPPPPPPPPPQEYAAYLKALKSSVWSASTRNFSHPTTLIHSFEKSVVQKSQHMASTEDLKDFLLGTNRFSTSFASTTQWSTTTLGDVSRQPSDVALTLPPCLARRSTFSHSPLISTENSQQFLNALEQTPSKSNDIIRSQTPLPCIASMKPVYANTQVSPTGGWKSGYPGRHEPALALPTSSLKLLTIDTSGRSFSHTPSSPTTDLEHKVGEDDVPDQIEQRPQHQVSSPSRRLSLMPTERPTLDTGYTREEVELADYLDGTKRLELGGYLYNVEGCVCSSSYGFVLKAKREFLHGKPKVKAKEVFVKMINRRSEAYKAVGRFINPEHTELALLRSRAVLHLPEYIEHYWTDDFLIIVTKTHGLRQKSWNPFNVKYHDVEWIYYFNQTA